MNKYYYEGKTKEQAEELALEELKVSKEDLIINSTEEKNNLLELLTNDIETLFKQNLNVSIITKDDKEAKKIYELLKDKYEYISLVNSNTVEFSKKLLVIPSYVSKGLEFDSAIIYTEKDNKYTKDEKNLFYVACTRTQHQLIIYNQ